MFYILLTFFLSLIVYKKSTLHLTLFERVKEPTTKEQIRLLTQSFKTNQELQLKAIYTYKHHPMICGI